MAATISANSAGGGGLVSSGDASGVLALQTAGVTALSIDASQKVTFANSLTSPTLVTPTIDSAQVPTISGTAPLYMCRAWVNFDGTTSGTFAGGTSTVSRTAGSTTATITTTNSHGLITGNSVYALTGVVAGAYTVTVLTLTTFTITTVATTVLTAASITFAVNSIRASGNVSSITDGGAGIYTVNFTTALPDANYSYTFGYISLTAVPSASTSTPSVDANVVSSSSLSIRVFQYLGSGNNAAYADFSSISVAIFR